MVTIIDNRPGADKRSRFDRRQNGVRHPEKAHRADTPVLKKPEWIRIKATRSPVYEETAAVVKKHNLHTVCGEAGCPNINECWSQRHATMMIMGDTCTRACAFCNVKTGVPRPLDTHEPEKVGQAVAELGLKHIVITSVDRDDLADGGAAHFAAVIGEIKRQAPGATIEVLTPDFRHKTGALEVVIDARPDVFNHNLETVPSHYLKIRPGARYFHSLRILQQAKELDPAVFTKSGIMVGLGETREEVLQVMDDLRSADVDFLTIGQYLQPSRKHAEVKRYVPPEEFKSRRQIAFAKVPDGLINCLRSSHHAGEDFAACRRLRRWLVLFLLSVDLVGHPMLVFLTAVVVSLMMMKSRRHAVSPAQTRIVIFICFSNRFFGHGGGKRRCC